LDSVKQFPVYRTPSFYPFNLENPNALIRVVHRLWETIFIPDGRILWNKGVKKNINKIINEHKPDIIFLTATPFSTFLLAPFLKKLYQIPIVLDYRDPWALTPMAGNNKLRRAVCLHLEKKTLAAADLVTTASYHAIDYIRKEVGEIAYAKTFWGFPYGFDGEFFKNNIFPFSHKNDSKEITGTFAGFVHGNLAAETVLAGIKLAIEGDKNVADRLKINCYGTLFGQRNHKQNLIEKYGLSKNIRVQEFLPYIEFLKVIHQSSFLFLPLCVGEHYVTVYPTKFFDYLGVKRPIFYIGSESQVSETMRKLNAGICCEPNSEAIAELLIDMVKNVNSPIWYDDSSAYEKFDRKNIFRDFCYELNRLSTLYLL